MKTIIRVIQSVFFGFALSCLILSVPAQGVVIEPNIVEMPGSAGGTFRFDYTINNPTGTSARAFQSTMSVSGPGTLTFDAAGSEAVASTNSNYWLFGNSGGAGAIDLGGNSYQFGDDPCDGLAQTLTSSDIMARYSFTWDGTVGDYTFTLDTSISNSFVMNEFFSNEVLQFTQGQYPGQGDSFMVTIPEPTTLMLFALGSAVLLKKRKA